MSRDTLDRYARLIERRWSELLDRPRVLSPGDWRWITEWHRRGIPVNLIEECIAATAERRKRSRSPRPPRGLAYLARAVDEAWGVIVEGARPADHSVADAPGPSAAPDSPIAAWRERLETEPPGSPLRRLLEGLLGQLEAGAEAVDVDAELDLKLVEAVDPPLVQAVEAEVRGRTRQFGAGLTGEPLRRAIERTRLARLRRRLKLPRLD